MSDFIPTIGEPCILCGNKVLYVGVATGDLPYIFENSAGALKRFSTLDGFEAINDEYEEIARICIDDVKVSNCESMPQAIKKLYDAGMLKLPGDN